MRYRACLGLLALLSGACSSDESGGNGSSGGQGAAAGAGATGGSGAQGGSGGSSGATGGTAGLDGGAATSGTGGTPVDGGGGTTQVPAYDVNRAKRQGCQYGSGLTTTDTIGPQVPHGDALPFEHIIVLMQENRSFDHYFSSLPAYGVTDVDVASPTATNPDPSAAGTPVPRFHETRYCTFDTNHEWDGSHTQYNGGAMDGFVDTNNPGGARAMGYYTDKDLPFYYWAVKNYAMSDRHFCSLLGPTWPNRFYFYGATSWGNIETGTIDPVTSDTFYKATKITDQLEQAGRTWKYYRDGLTSFMTLWGLTTKNQGAHTSQFITDVQNDALPHLSIIDPNFTGSGQNDEHPPSNVQAGQQFVAKIYQALISNPVVWKKSVFIVFYDEHGGFYDHVPPPPACEPDNLPPPTEKFDRLGFRTPMFVMSPYSKAGYVSHLVTDITSITRFIQNRFDLPSMTKRDSNAWPMLDMFDFANPPFLTPATGAPSAAPDPAGVTWCANNPPGTGTP
ncbi:MAG: alkaline phosphatase family protein [Polyangiaceae bacterium]